MLESEKKSKRNKFAKSFESKGVRGISTSEETIEERKRKERLSAFLKRKRSDSDHVRKQIEKRKKGLGLNFDANYTGD
jgi:hypothetical protein